MSIALKIETSYQLIIDVVGMCGKSWQTDRPLRYWASFYQSKQAPVIPMATPFCKPGSVFFRAKHKAGVADLRFIRLFGFDRTLLRTFQQSRILIFCAIQYEIGSEAPEHAGKPIQYQFRNCFSSVASIDLRFL